MPGGQYFIALSVQFWTKPFYEFADCEQVYKGRHNIWKPLGFSEVRRLQHDSVLCKSLMLLCCVSQWTILTALFFLSMNFTEEWSNRDRGQHVYPVWCLCSKEWGSHIAFEIADYKGRNKSHLHTTLREGFVISDVHPLCTVPVTASEATLLGL